MISLLGVRLQADNTLRYSIGPDFELRDLGGDFFERSGFRRLKNAASLSELR